MQRMKAIRLKPEAAGYVVQLALKATQVPMADTFGPYIQNALNWIYSNGGHFGVAENSPLDNYMAQAVLAAQANNGGGQRPPVQQSRPVPAQPPQQPVQMPVQQPAQVQQAAPFIQQAPQAVPVQAPIMQQQAVSPVSAQPSGEAPSLTTAPIQPGQDALTNSDAVMLG